MSDFVDNKKKRDQNKKQEKQNKLFQSKELKNINNSQKIQNHNECFMKNVVSVITIMQFS